MSIKQLFKKFYADIKLWGWYDWIKYILASSLFILGVCLAVGLAFLPGYDSGGILIKPILLLPIFAIAWLIHRDYRLPYILLILLGGLGISWSWQGLGVFYDNFPRLIDIINIVLIIISVLCITKITINKRNGQNVRNGILSKISVFIVCVWTALVLLGISVFSSMPDDDNLRIEIARECIQTKIADGYPRDFAREYCLGVSEFCTSRNYSENCNPELYCCFTTIAEDMKWNYLDYDEQGNKITD